MALPESTEFAPELPELSRLERLEIISQELGFLPVSKREQTDVLALEASQESRGGTAVHLADIYQHQTRAFTEEAGKAPRKVLHGYVDSAANAAASAQALVKLRTDLEDVNPELIAEEVFDENQPGLLEYLRYQDLGELRDGKTLRQIGYDPQMVDYSPGNGGIMFYLERAMKRWHIKELKQGVEPALDDQTHRFFFFVERLDEVVRYSDSKQLRDIAQAGLGEFFPPSTVE